MKYIVDQINETLVTCETDNKTTIILPKELFPKEVTEGDVVEVDEKKKVAVILKEETSARRERIRTLMQDLWE